MCPGPLLQASVDQLACMHAWQWCGVQQTQVERTRVCMAFGIRCRHAASA